MTVPDYEAIIRRTFADLDRWRLLARNGWTPAPGSALAVDDEDWPWWPLSQLAVAGLAAGRDHIGAVQGHLERGEPFPFADGTLLRSGMLGAATAVWLLAPNDRAARLKRARTVAAEVYDKHAQFLGDLSSLSGGDHAGTEAVKNHVAERTKELARLRDAAGERATFQATHVVEAAAKAALGEPYGLEARVEWRRGSGAAHGLPWSLLGVQTTTQLGAGDGQGMAMFQAAGGWSAVANGYMAAYHLLRRGWELMDQRGGTPA